LATPSLTNIDSIPPALTRMSPIGPAIPEHLLNQTSVQHDDQQDDESPQAIGPQIPAGLVEQTRPETDEEEDEDDYAPALPPDMIPARSSAPIVSNLAESSSSTNKRVAGPALPSYPPIYDPNVHSFDDDDDDDIGPKPLPAGVKHAEKDAVTEFIEREERRKKLAEVCVFT
jgi:hypothetical protein